ncbi:hypothetical protein EZV62_014329 [Acer yangbiense]|uniref:DUF8204 domain-containing protein n=1 Tax=Acer yangbiense TaxID=1000413 RepID=A0A5C7HTY3_9ROSI|nr:hypothetical protein EZV62_014329 [Acer yangbiense]
MDTSKEVDGGGNNNKQEKHESEAVKGGGGGDSIRKGRSCIGYHYFSSSLKSSNGKPRCIGLPRPLQQGLFFFFSFFFSIPIQIQFHRFVFYFLFDSFSLLLKLPNEAIRSSEAKALEFGSRTLLACVGLEHLWDVKVTSGDTGSTPAPAHSKVGEKIVLV